MPSYGDLERAEVARLLPSGVKRVLDVGCCYGGFGASLEARGIEVWGIESDPIYAAKAQGRLTKVISGLFPEAVPAGERFDCVTFNDVLEHMPDPAKALTLTPALLNPGGWVLASIPNVRHVTVLVNLALKGRWDYVDAGILDRTHLRFFTKATMRDLFEQSGLRVDSITPLTTTRLTPKLLPMKLLGRTREEFLVVQYGVLARVP